MLTLFLYTSFVVSSSSLYGPIAVIALTAQVQASVEQKLHQGRRMGDVIALARPEVSALAQTEYGEPNEASVSE